MCDAELTTRALKATQALGVRIKADMHLCYAAAGMLVALSMFLMYMLMPVLTSGSFGLRMASLAILALPLTLSVHLRSIVLVVREASWWFSTLDTNAPALVQANVALSAARRALNMHIAPPKQYRDAVADLDDIVTKLMAARRVEQVRA